MSIVGWLILLIAAFGTVAVTQISWKHLTGQKRCPSIGPVPICYLVFAGYVAILVSVFTRSLPLFLAGLIPVLAFAAAGTFGELILKKDVCPKTSGGIPQCYFSFVASLVVAFSGLILFS